MLTPDQINAVAQSHGLSVSQPVAPQASASPAGPSAGPSAADAYAKRVGYNQSTQSDDSSTFDKLKEVGGDIGESFNERQANVDKIKGSDASLGSKLFQTAGQGAGFLSDVAMDVVKPAIKPEVKQGVKDTMQAVMQTPAAQSLAKAWAAFEAEHPEVAGNIKATGNLASVIPTVGGEAAAAKLGEKGLQEGATAAVDTVKAGLGSAKDVISKIKPGAMDLIPKGATPAEQALNDVLPDFKNASPTEKGKLINSTVKGQPRVNEGTAFGERTVTPTKLEKEASDALQKVPGYKPEDTYLNKHNVVKTEIAKQAKALRASLKAEKVVVPKREVYSAVKKSIDSVPDESLLLQSSDPSITNYTRVLQNVVAKEPGNLEGVLNMRQALDDAYENARGRLSYPGGEEKLGALDEVHTAARDSLTQYAIDHAVNTDVKASLKSQWDLFRADDIIRGKAAKEAGTGAGRVMQNHPIATNVVKAGAKYTGLGAGLHLLP